MRTEREIKERLELRREQLKHTNVNKGQMTTTNTENVIQGCLFSSIDDLMWVLEEEKNG